ncbi:hypothetical protein E2C01_027520 [Portunus trituberculatus]|uniref:Uncharacterized protein n=1 Tax=Portunus trituberculatus TaxID=210409 RepID=A0A5B7EIB9_PORTR|nr:hypothetical protein [Portunus trituberculatus]
MTQLKLEILELLETGGGLSQFLGPFFLDAPADFDAMKSSSESLDTISSSELNKEQSASSVLFEREEL